MLRIKSKNRGIEGSTVYRCDQMRLVFALASIPADGKCESQ